MNKSLFKISEELEVVISQIEEAGGEATPEQEQQLIISRNELQTKGLNYVHLIKKLENDLELAKVYLEQIKLFKVRKEAIIDRLRESLLNAVDEFGDIETDLFKITTRKSEAVEIVDENKVPMFCYRTKTTKEIDKVKIKELIKKGEEVPGAILKENKNLSIK
jgi:hypothetical protein